MHIENDNHREAGTHETNILSVLEKSIECRKLFIKYFKIILGRSD